MDETAASIDLGSHTARLLIARRDGSSPWGWTPLVRRRIYTRLAVDSGAGGEGPLDLQGKERAIGALREFARLIARYPVGQIHAVATGIFRDSPDGGRFLTRLHEETGIRVALISGEREAELSGRGACGVLGLRGDSLVFDLGGGTTEFFRDRQGETKGISLNLGAAVLTREYLRSDPPREGEVNDVKRVVKERLSAVASDIRGPSLLVGTGGTVATLAAMICGIGPNDMTPEEQNGRVIPLAQVAACLQSMKGLTAAERVSRLGLDPGRADVIVAGALVVLGILEFLERPELMVSMADLLEGLLLEASDPELRGRGDGNERKGGRPHGGSSRAMEAGGKRPRRDNDETANR